MGVNGVGMHETAASSRPRLGGSLEASRGISRRVLAWIFGLQGFFLIAGQRLSIPINDLQFPVSLAAALALIVSLVIAGSQVSTTGLFVYLCIVGSASVSAIAQSQSSIASLLTLLACYAPIVFISADNRSRHISANFTRGAVFGIIAGSFLGIIQALLQWIGYIGLWDPIYTYVSPRFMLTGYNSTYSLEYVTTDMGLGVKPNGALFLEPSFLSLYSAIGLVALVEWRRKITSPQLRLNTWALLFCAGGLVVSISSSGLLILAFAGFFWGKQFTAQPRLVLAGTALALLSWRLGALDALITKASEGFGPSTSAGLRLTLPYDLMAPRLFESPLWGLGPGEAGAVAAEYNIAGLQVPTLLKIGVEYGVLGLAAFGLLLAYLVISRQVPTTLFAGVVSAWAIPAESLLNPVLATLLVLTVAPWSSSRGNEAEHPTPAREDR